MKIIIDALPLIPARKSGIGKYVENIVRGLDELNADYALLVPKTKRRLLEPQYPGVTIIELPYKARTIKLLDLLGVMPAVDRYGGAGCYFFGAFDNKPLSRRSTSVTCFHDMAFRRHPDTVRALNRIFLQLFYRKWLRRTDLIATVSKFSEAEIARLTGTKKPIVIVPNALSPGLRAPLPSRADARKVVAGHGVDFADFLLFVGSIEPRKGLFAFLDWYRSKPVAWRQANKLVLIGGDGWKSDNVRQLIADINQKTVCIIRPDSYVSDSELPAFFSLAKACLLPSLYEGYGVPLVEAAAAGKPAIISTIEPLRDIVQELALRPGRVGGFDTDGSDYEIVAPTKVTAARIVSPRQAAQILLDIAAGAGK